MMYVIVFAYVLLTVNAVNLGEPDDIRPEADAQLSNRTQLLGTNGFEQVNTTKDDSVHESEREDHVSSVMKESSSHKKSAEDAAAITIEYFDMVSQQDKAYKVAKKRFDAAPKRNHLQTRINPIRTAKVPITTEVEMDADLKEDETVDPMPRNQIFLEDSSDVTVRPFDSIPVLMARMFTELPKENENLVKLSAISPKGIVNSRELYPVLVAVVILTALAGMGYVIFVERTTPTFAAVEIRDYHQQDPRTSPEKTIEHKESKSVDEAVTFRKESVHQEIERGWNSRDNSPAYSVMDPTLIPDEIDVGGEKGMYAGPPALLLPPPAAEELEYSSDAFVEIPVSGSSTEL